jgi:hypothetical protein
MKRKERKGGKERKIKKRKETVELESAYFV